MGHVRANNRERLLLPFLTLPSAGDTMVTVSGRLREVGFESLVLKGAGYDGVFSSGEVAGVGGGGLAWVWGLHVVSAVPMAQMTGACLVDSSG